MIQVTPMVLRHALATLGCRLPWPLSLALHSRSGDNFQNWDSVCYCSAEPTSSRFAMRRRFLKTEDALVN